MKKLKYIIPLTLLVLASAGCKKELTNAQVNNNQPSSVSPNVLLTWTEANMGYVLGGDFSRFEGLFDQQLTAGASARQFTSYDVYTFSTTDFNASWQNLYTGLLNLKTLRNQATANSYNVYAGVADVLMAQSWGALTDVYGDIPYTQALLGATNLQPKVDKQQVVYDSIQGLLDSAIMRLGATKPGNLVPGSDDLVYGGDAGKWTRLAWSLKARYYLHLRKVDPSNIAKAAAAAANGLSSNADDAYVAYGSSAASASPWAQFEQNRSGELSFIAGSAPPMSSLLDTMFADGDPRINGFIDTSTADQQYDMPQAFFGNYVANNGNVAIMTYAELMFIKAELDFVQGGGSAAETDYQAAVTASLTAFTPPNPLKTPQDTLNYKADSIYIAHNVTLVTAPTLNQIMTQKWIALFLNPESFSDWRRTGYPTLSPNPGATTAIPRRFLYAQQAIDGNSHISAIEPSISLQSRVWWDVP